MKNKKPWITLGVLILLVAAAFVVNTQFQQGQFFRALPGSRRPTIIRTDAIRHVCSDLSTRGSQVACGNWIGTNVPPEASQCGIINQWMRDGVFTANLTTLGINADVYNACGCSNLSVTGNQWRCMAWFQWETSEGKSPCALLQRWMAEGTFTANVKTLSGLFSGAGEYIQDDIDRCFPAALIEIDGILLPYP